jgi:parvulin-like peptidyl-prolyl isomerase
MFSRLIKIIIIFALITILAACSSGTNPSTPVVPAETQSLPSQPVTATETVLASPTAIDAAATVNGEVISKTEFLAETERFKAAQTALGKQTSDDDARKTVLEDLISQVLLAQGANEAGFVVDEAMLQARLDKLTEQAGGPDALSKWQADQGYTPDTFREALRRSISTAWMRDQIIAKVSTSADQVHIRQILFYNEDRAREVMGEIQAGRTDFDSFATLVDPVTRGDLGWFPHDYIAEKDIEQAAFALQQDQISDVITTELGFHIIKVLGREKRPLSPDALLTLQTNAVHDWLEQRRIQSKIVIMP